MEVLTFTHPSLGDIRGMEIDGKPWLVGKDVAVALGYKNPQLAIRTHIEDKDKGMTKVLTPGGRQNVPIINENGFYSLAFKSKLPNAKEIREWVTTSIFMQLRPKPAIEETPVQCSFFDEEQCKNGNNDGEKVAESNALEVFQNPEFGQIRILTEGEKMLFCSSDVAKALGYARPNDAVSAHCRYTVKRRIPHPQAPDKSIEMLFIPEGDVYRLIVRSALPSAEKFERWVFDDVLPTIRKHGLYAAEELLDNPDVMIKVLQELQKERAAKEALTEENEQLTRDKNLLEQKNATQVRRIALLQPKAKYYDTCLFCEDLFPISIISKDFGWSANQMNKFLSDLGVQYRQGEGWLLAQKYAERGYARSRTYLSVGKDGKPHASIRTCWTQKGRRFIVALMKEHGHLPIAANDIA